MRTAPASTAAAAFEPLFNEVFDGPAPIPIEFWDGSSTGLVRDGGPGILRIESPDALRRIMWAPGELGFGRAFVVGDISHEGDTVALLRAFQRGVGGDLRVGPAVLRAAWRAIEELDIPKRALPPPEEEMVPRRLRDGLRHSRRRDSSTVRHHYDVGNDFYALVLGPSMTYSCARFTAHDLSLADAQGAKHELVCRKLGLADARFRADSAGERPRLLDVGCGWGSMAIHAATAHDVDVVGVTLSPEQAERAQKRVADAGLQGRVEIRVQDYREVADGPYDAISSIGMAEHVGHRRMREYFDLLFGLLRPRGRLLNHAIASVGGSVMRSRSFVGRYVFPDGELLDMGRTVLSMESAGFEVRDLENLREHYAMTLRHWVHNLEEQWDAAVELVGERRARVWQLHMSASVNAFEDGGLQLGQTLGVRPDAAGASGMPPTRVGWG